MKSIVNGKIYIGQTKDLRGRIDFHNSVKARWTKRYQPWELIYKEEYASRSEAMKKRNKFKKVEQN